MSETFYTVAVFTYPTEVIVPRITLETAGIECIAKDEETITANPLLSNAVGGIKLQVKETDYPMAVELLKESGVEIFQASNDESIWVHRLEKFTRRIPLIGKLSLERRMLVVLGISIVAIGMSFYLATRLHFEKAIIDRHWCLEVEVHHRPLRWVEPNESGASRQVAVPISFTNCYESILFKSNGLYALTTRFNERINGYWKLSGGELHLFDADTLGAILNGSFELDLREN